MSSENKDLALTILARRFFQAMGFCTELKVPVFIPIYGTVYKRSPASDVDVLGIRFDPDFEPCIAIGEAKTGEEKALEELLKVRAVAEYLKAKKRFLIKSRVHQNAREIGRNLGVVCLDESELVQVLKNLAVNDGAPSAEELLNYRQQQAWLLSMRRQKQSQPLANYLESEVWSRRYWENLHNLIYMLRFFLKTSKAKPQPFVEFAIFRATGVISISILYLCRQIITSSLSKLERGVELYVFGGPAARRQRERLRDEIQRVVPSLKGFNIAMEPPFLTDLKEIVAYFTISPREAVLTPQVFSEAVGIIAVTGGNFDPTKWSGGHNPVALKLAKDVLQFVLKSCGQIGSCKSLADFLAL